MDPSIQASSQGKKEGKKDRKEQSKEEREGEEPGGVKQQWPFVLFPLIQADLCHAPPELQERA